MDDEVASGEVALTQLFMIDFLIYDVKQILRSGDGQLCVGVEVCELLLELSHDRNFVFDEDPEFFVSFVENAWFDQSVSAIWEADKPKVSIACQVGVGFPDQTSDDDDEGQNYEFKIFLELFYTFTN